MKVYCNSCTFQYHTPTKELECPSCGTTAPNDFVFLEDDPIATRHPKIKKWVEIGRKNYWIARAYDPVFSDHSFYECKSITELIEKLKRGNWSVGTAFYYKNIAFINQVNGGDEWLIIRDEIDFESWSCGYVLELYGEKNFLSTLYQMFHASEQQLKKLDYGEVVVPDNVEQYFSNEVIEQ